MNYTKIYNSLIEHAKYKEYDGYTEVHHIIPKCIGGTNEVNNLVRLSAREHFVAHLLLSKMYPKSGLPHALWRMANGKGQYKFSSRIYEIARKMHAERIFGDKNANWKKGRKGDKNAMFGKTHNEEVRRIIAEANKQKLVCPHCDKIGGIAIMQRWHFDKCKLSPTYVPPKKMKRVKPTEETKQKVRDTVAKKMNSGWVSPNKGTRQKKDCTCSHCGIVCGAGQYTRWHGVNCKQNLTSRWVSER